MKWPLAGLLAFAVLGAACGSDNTTPTTPTAPTSSLGTETLKGAMAQKGQALRTFTVLQAGTVTVTYDGTDPVSSTVLGLGIGIRAATGIDCQFTRTLNTAPSTTPQISIAVDPGTYCAGVYDIGTVGPNGITVSVTVSRP